MNQKIGIILLLFVISAGCGCVTIENSGNITITGKEMYFENRTLEGQNTSYTQLLYDAENDKWLPMPEIEIDPCTALEAELKRYNENVTFGDFCLTTNESHILKWKMENETWSKVCFLEISAP